MSNDSKFCHFSTIALFLGQLQCLYIFFTIFLMSNPSLHGGHQISGDIFCHSLEAVFFSSSVLVWQVCVALPFFQVPHFYWIQPRCQFPLFLFRKPLFNSGSVVWIIVMVDYSYSVKHVHLVVLSATILVQPVMILFSITSVLFIYKCHLSNTFCTHTAPYQNTPTSMLHCDASCQVHTKHIGLHLTKECSSSFFSPF